MSSDVFGEIFGKYGVPRSAPPRPGDDTRSQSAKRQECAQRGHRYQVHGKANPTKVACSRCEVSWAIGPRTEPPA